MSLGALPILLLKAENEEEGKAGFRHPSSVAGLCTDVEELVDVVDAVDILGVIPAGLGTDDISCLDDASVGVCGRSSASSSPSSPT